VGEGGERFVRDKLACVAVPLFSREGTGEDGAAAVSGGAAGWAEAITVIGSLVEVTGTGASIGAATDACVFSNGGDVGDLTDAVTGTRSFFVGTGAGGLGDAATGDGVIFPGAVSDMGACSIIVEEDKWILGGGAMLSCAGGLADAI